MKISTRTNAMAPFGACVLAFATIAVVPQPANAVLQLTIHNFEKMTTGKSVFIKFFAPWYAVWCGVPLLLLLLCGRPRLVR